MTTKHIHLVGLQTKHDESPHYTMQAVTAYVLMAFCYLLIGLTLFLFWEKANHG